MLDQLSISGLEWLPILLGVGAAYIVFGIAGFGTALVAGPVLIHFMPLSRIIPLLVLLDFVAAFGNLLPSRRDVVRGPVATGAVAVASTCDSTAAGRETLRLSDGGYHVLYERFVGEVAWTRVSLTLRSHAAARLSHWPERAVVCGDDHVPPRTCKNRTVFRERLLR